MKNIGIDIDDTSLDFVPAVCEYYNARFGDSLKREDFYIYQFEKIWKRELPESIKIVDDFLATPKFKDMNPIGNSRKIIPRLRDDGHRLSVITARLKLYEPITEYQMQKNFDNAFEGRHFHGGQFDTDPTKRKTKSQMCLEQGIELMIEDNPLHALDCANNGIQVFMIDTPWNQIIQPHEKIQRVYNWEQIYAQI